MVGVGQFGEELSAARSCGRVDVVGCARVGAVDVDDELGMGAQPRARALVAAAAAATSAQTERSSRTGLRGRPAYVATAARAPPAWAARSRSTAAGTTPGWSTSATTHASPATADRPARSEAAMPVSQSCASTT